MQNWAFFNACPSLIDGCEQTQPVNDAIVELVIPDWEGIQTGRSLFFTLAEASELLELINRDRRIETYEESWI